jgi:stage IV sporulation protein FB
VGLLARGDIVRALKERGPKAPVGEAMATGIPTIGHRQCLDEAFRILQETSAAAIGVVDAQGRLVGLVTPGTVGEMMMVRDALPGRPGYGPWGRPAGA